MEIFIFHSFSLTFCYRVIQKSSFFRSFTCFCLEICTIIQFFKSLNAFHINPLITFIATESIFVLIPIFPSVIFYVFLIFSLDFFPYFLFGQS